MAEPLYSAADAFGRVFAHLPDSGGGIELTPIDARAALLASSPARPPIDTAPDLGLALPDMGRRNGNGSRTALGVGAGRWLLLDRSGTDIAALAAQRLHGAFAVTDQSDALAILRIGGPAVRAMLAHLVGIDLHPDRFGAGCAAATALALMRVYIACTEDGASFEIAAPRSMAHSFAHHILTSAAPFGVALRR